MEPIRKILTNVEVLRYREFSGTINELSDAMLTLQQEYLVLDEKNKQLQTALDKMTNDNVTQKG